MVAASGFTSGDVMDVQKNIDFKRNLKFMWWHVEE